MAVSRALIGDKGDNYSTEPVENIIKYANIDEKTAYTYINFLFDIQILFKITVRDFNKKTGNLKDYNVYSRWCDREIVVRAIESNEWIKDKLLLKVGNKELTQEERAKVKNKARNLTGFPDIY
ncbi:hypothetical protein CXF70_09200 [Planomicrobium sp. MB-3u-38]|nr:hypothetical protein CXF70_09200 [Planomicrobium sp. MB-3u-38]